MTWPFNGARLFAGVLIIGALGIAGCGSGNQDCPAILAQGGVMINFEHFRSATPQDDLALRLCIDSKCQDRQSQEPTDSYWFIAGEMTPDQTHEISFTIRKDATVVFDASVSGAASAVTYGAGACAQTVSRLKIEATAAGVLTVGP